MLQLVFNHLFNSGAFVAVKVAENIEAIGSDAVGADDGTVFVAPWRERARPPRDATGGHRQLIEVQFVTIMVIRRHDDPNGGERARAFDTFKGQVQTLLAGWQPEPGGDVVSLVGGEGQSLGNGVSIYVQTWQITTFLTGVYP